MFVGYSVILFVVVLVDICSLLCVFCIFLFFVALPKTNIAPENKSSQKERSIFQPSILPQNMTPDCPIQPWHNPSIGGICWYITVYILSVSRKPVRQTPYILSPNRQKLKLLFENLFCNNPTIWKLFFVVFESKRSFGNFRKHCFCKQSYFGNVFLQIERKCLKVAKSCGLMFANFFSTKQHVSLRKNILT